MSDSVVGKTVVITGAANGIGRALALELARRGARIALCDIDQAGLDAVLAELPAPNGQAHQAHPLDICDATRVEAVIGAIARDMGGIDVLVNNAGISHHSLARETSRDVLRRVMDINFHGAVNCTLAALPSLTERRGIIAVMSSVAGFSPLSRRSAYSASKHALHGWFETLRAELEPDHVAVMMVCPSFVQTGIDQRALAGDGGPAPRGKPVVGRVAAPDEIAVAIADGVERRRRQLIPTTIAKVAWWLSRVSPRTYQRLMVRSQNQ